MGNSTGFGPAPLLMLDHSGPSFVKERRSRTRADHPGFSCCHEETRAARFAGTSLLDGSSLTLVVGSDLKDGVQ